MENELHYKHCTLVDKVVSYRERCFNAETTKHVHWNWTINSMDGGWCHQWANFLTVGWEVTEKQEGKAGTR